MYTFLFKDNFDFDVLRHRQTILFSFVSRKGHDSLLSKYIVNICSVVLFQSLLEAWSLWRTEFYKLMDIIYDAIFNHISFQVESFMTVSELFIKIIIILFEIRNFAADIKSYQKCYAGWQQICVMNIFWGIRWRRFGDHYFKMW